MLKMLWLSKYLKSATTSTKDKVYWTLRAVQYFHLIGTMTSKAQTLSVTELPKDIFSNIWIIDFCMCI